MRRVQAVRRAEVIRLNESLEQETVVNDSLEQETVVNDSKRRKLDYMVMMRNWVMRWIPRCYLLIRSMNLRCWLKIGRIFFNLYFESNS